MPNTKYFDDIRQMVLEGGGQYVGIHKGTCNGKRISPDLVLFNSPQTGSTLALPISKLSANAVRQHISKSNARFGVATP